MIRPRVIPTPSVTWLALVCALSISVPASAQQGESADAREIRTTLGIRTGAAVAKLVSDQDNTTQGRITPSIGLYGEMRINRIVSLVLDVLYAEFGGNAVNPVPMYGKDSISGHKVERMNLLSRAIEIPLQLKLRPSLSTPIIPYVSLGASTAVFLGTTSDNYIMTDSTVHEFGVDMSPVINSNDWAGLGAIGIDVRSTRVQWSVEIFTRFGMTALNRPRVAGMTGYRASSAGIKIGIGR